jgi:RimJ/RimL family protein N-acetyltransferase
MSEAENQSNTLSIRPAEESDAELLWHWANDASVRARSFNPEPISWESHLGWFRRRLASPETKFYLLLENNIPVGQIRYDLDESGESAIIGFSVAGEHRGKGFGVEILRQTVGEAVRELKCREIVGIVIEGNEASSKAFLRAGFTNKGETEIDGKRASRFVWKPAKS